MSRKFILLFIFLFVCNFVSVVSAADLRYDDIPCSDYYTLSEWLDHSNRSPSTCPSIEVWCEWLARYERYCENSGHVEPILDCDYPIY
ncbi:hypothetical protein [uncultured Methanobrevibacter sp.]|uniref:hypothetical protein n=1 Tax=uncultured Methanobrevibacter sp. TaxID=253161 RepID=UPI0025CFE128|nr:hypothetical protein [uncultured Methanobrevibacter sp.]